MNTYYINFLPVNYKGPYSATTAYKKYDVVSYLTQLYVLKVDTATNILPTVAATWDVMETSEMLAPLVYEDDSLTISPRSRSISTQELSTARNGGPDEVMFEGAMRGFEFSINAVFDSIQDYSRFIKFISSYSFYIELDIIDAFEYYTDESKLNFKCVVNSTTTRNTSKVLIANLTFKENPRVMKIISS